MRSLLILCSLLLVATVRSQHVGPGETKDETREEAFARADANKDNALTFDEYLRLSKGMSEMLDAGFKTIDTNNDGKLTVDELKAHYGKVDADLMTKNAQTSARYLKGFDANHNGFLEVDELTNFIETERMQKTDKLAEIIKPFDKNADGKLDQKEFNDFLSHYPYDQFSRIQLPKA